MTEVIHPLIDSVTYEYCGQSIKTWNDQSHILQVLQAMTAEFNEEAPIPKALFDPGNKPRATMSGKSAAYLSRNFSAASDDA